MSVMILDAKPVGQLVAWAEANMVKADSCRAQAHRMMGCKIVEMNHAAFNGRYKFWNDDMDFGEVNRAYNEYKKVIGCVDAAVIYQFARSLEYQLCECDDFKPGNPVRDYLARVKVKAADKMVYQILGDAAQDAWAPDDLVDVRKKGAAA